MADLTPVPLSPSPRRLAADLCPEPAELPASPTQPLAPPIYTAAVYRCADPDEAERLLSGQEAGYVYGRDGHPNADILAEKCGRLHAAEEAVICGSGMGALAAALLAHAESGSHVIASDQLYGKTLALLQGEAARLGITTTAVDTCDLTAIKAAFRPTTRLVLVETVSNPLLRVCDLEAVAALTHAQGARLLVDNTFASPVLCRPLDWGADLVVESLTKIMGGHSDVLLGLLCGRTAAWSRVKQVVSTWGLSAGPFDCWLANRGIGTLAVRLAQAGINALAAADRLRQHPAVASTCYPGLPEHLDHALAARLLDGNFGHMLTFTLRGGLPAAREFIRAARQIPFCPSLGDISTTLSHPASTSHRGQSAAARELLGIYAGTLRLSLGIESTPRVLAAVEEGLAGVTG